VEAFLGLFLDCRAPVGAPVTLGARSLAGLQALVEEQPEVCPLLRSQLNQFNNALKEWMLSWPAVEPTRQGLPRVSSSGDGAGNTALRAPPTAEDLELELHGVVDILSEYGMLHKVSCPGSAEMEGEEEEPPGGREAAEAFYQAALGWTFKLASFYGLDLLGQPARLAQACSIVASAPLSLLAWSDEAQVAELLRCPFFRPPERELQRLAQRWVQERTGAAGDEPVELPEVFALALEQDLLEEQPPSGPSSSEAAPAAAAEAALPSTSQESGAPLQDAADAAGPEDAIEPQAPPPAADAAVAEKTTQRIWGSSFKRVARRADCATAVFDDPAGLQIAERARTSDTLRCWNVAGEAVVIGAARQVMASDVPMQSTGRFRLDLRVVAGVEAEAAHLLEIGICAEPFAGVHFAAGEPGAGRPSAPGERAGGAPFFRFCSVPDLLLEGVRLSIEVDFDKAEAHFRNIPDVEGVAPVPPAPMLSWLKERERMTIIKNRPTGELECTLFKSHAEHLQDLIDQGTLDGDLAGAVLGDSGARVASGQVAAVRPEVPEDYHFYVVLPVGMEIEMF